MQVAKLTDNKFLCCDKIGALSNNIICGSLATMLNYCVYYLIDLARIIISIMIDNVAMDGRCRVRKVVYQIQE